LRGKDGQQGGPVRGRVRRRPACGGPEEFAPRRLPAPARRVSHQQEKPGPRFALGTAGGTALTLTSINPISLLVLSATINGIAAAPFLIVVMIISHNRQLMGTRRNHLLASVLGWITVAMMTIAAIAMLALLAGL